MLQNSTRSSAFKRCFEVLYFILVQTLQSFDAIFWGQKKCQRIGLCLVPFGKEEGNMIHSLLKTCIVHRKTTSFSFEKIETFFPCISQGKSSLFILLCQKMDGQFYQPRSSAFSLFYLIVQCIFSTDWQCSSGGSMISQWQSTIFCLFPKGLRDEK